jgi:hypothetical protein
MFGSLFSSICLTCVTQRRFLLCSYFSKATLPNRVYFSKEISSDAQQSDLEMI